ncbi:DoxX family protein [Aurantiacibacter zhengii]|uniref:DoxX family protein n=1 Tax=Aurantiacibacter zhengii TaxID=2307003 RepID=A0A418NUZ2_9SPHN|nr:DoxX family protein [Aurantiacibacter zhengii]RIV87748.1 hypothetical protein D2V07_05265 [Aurantiacibacter zhengii]
MRQRQTGLNLKPIASFVALALLVVCIGGFSLFVGWNKAFAPLDILARHSAWTIHLPVWLGRTIGWLELFAAAVLFAGLIIPKLARFGMFAAIWITLNHVAAAIVHIIFAEWHTLPQSAVVITLCVVMVLLFARLARSVEQYA